METASDDNATIVNVYETTLSLPLLARGKVRDIYDAGNDRLLLVSTDRLSAFDVVFPDPIPGKGQVLNQLSAFWFRETSGIIKNHLMTTDISDMGLDIDEDQTAGRSTLCLRTKPFPVECVVRGYLEGSAWKDYQETGCVSGIELPKGLSRRQKLGAPIFTPSTKAESGHDMPISFSEVVDLIGRPAADRLEQVSIALYRHAHDYLEPRGIILSDTKFEFGEKDGEILLIDEALTPDSSRFWEAASYGPAGTPQSYDKQFVRDYVETLGWNKQPPAPELPDHVIAGTTSRYLEIFSIITGQDISEEGSAQ